MPSRLPLEREQRLVLEEERLRALPSFMFRLDHFELSGLAAGAILHDGREYPIRIQFGLDFPCQRPTLWTEQEEVKALPHVNRAGEICTLRYQPDDWDPEAFTAADLVERAWKLIVNRGELGPDENDSVPQAVDFHLGARVPIFLAPEDAEVEAGLHGTASLVRTATLMQGYTLDALEGADGRMLWIAEEKTSENPLVTSGEQVKRLRIPWFSAPQPPPYALQSLEELHGILPIGFDIHGLLVQWGKRLKLKESTTGRILVHFKDETRARWTFIEAPIRRSRTGKVQETAAPYYLPSYTVGPDAFFGRIEGLVAREKLEKAHALVIGNGALGSGLSFYLNQVGVGKLTIFDPDQVEPGNPVRGQLPFSHLGLAKVDSTRITLAQHLPFTKVQPIGHSTTTPEGRAKLHEILYSGEVNLVVVAIGNHHLSRGLDRLLANFDVPRIYTWTTRGAEAGVVLTLPPASSGENVPTYETYHQLVTTGALPELPEVSEEEQPDVPERGCSTPVLPGAPLDTTAVALHAARTAVDLLQGEVVAPFQYWIRADQSWEAQTLTLSDSVQEWTSVASNAQLSKVVLSYDVRLAIEAEIRQSPAVETGGVLAGHLDGKTLHVEYASGPGPRARRTRHRLRLDHRYAQGCIDAVRVLSNERLRFYGEWHSHPTNNLIPSPDDLRSLHRLAQSRTANISVPVILIVFLDEHGDLAGHAHTVTGGTVSRVDLELPNFIPYLVKF